MAPGFDFGLILLIGVLLAVGTFLDALSRCVLRFLHGELLQLLSIFAIVVLILIVVVVVFVLPLIILVDLLLTLLLHQLVTTWVIGHVEIICLLLWYVTRESPGALQRLMLSLPLFARSVRDGSPCCNRLLEASNILV